MSIIDSNDIIRIKLMVALEAYVNNLHVELHLLFITNRVIAICWDKQTLLYLGTLPTKWNYKLLTLELGLIHKP